MAVKKATVADVVAKAAAAKAESKEETKAAAKEPAKKADTKTEAKAPAKKAETKTAAKASAKKAETKTEAKAPAKKTETKKAEAKTSAKKAETKTAAKAPAKKAPAKKAATTEKVVIEFAGGQIAASDIIAKAVEVSGKKSIKELNVYYQPENGKVYFTADGEKGEFDI